MKLYNHGHLSFHVDPVPKLDGLGRSSEVRHPSLVEIKVEYIEDTVPYLEV